MKSHRKLVEKECAKVVRDFAKKYKKYLIRIFGNNIHLMDNQYTLYYSKNIPGRKRPIDIVFTFPTGKRK